MWVARRRDIQRRRKEMGDMEKIREIDTGGIRIILHRFGLLPGILRNSIGPSPTGRWKSRPFYSVERCTISKPNYCGALDIGNVPKRPNFPLCRSSSDIRAIQGIAMRYPPASSTRRYRDFTGIKSGIFFAHQEKSIGGRTPRREQ